MAKANRELRGEYIRVVDGKGGGKVERDVGKGELKHIRKKGQIFMFYGLFSVLWVIFKGWKLLGKGK